MVKLCGNSILQPSVRRSRAIARTYRYYDGQNRVYIIQQKPYISGAAQTQALFKYEYFADSSLKKEKTEGWTGSGSTGLSWDGVHDYAYDPRGQLTGDTHTPYTVSGSSSTSGTAVTTAYAFDAAGNREDVTVDTTTTDYTPGRQQRARRRRRRRLPVRRRRERHAD